MSARSLPGSVTRAAACAPRSLRSAGSRSDDASQATAVPCRERLCGPDAESPDETTCGDGRALPGAPGRALLQPLPVRRSRQLGGRRPRRRGSRAALGRRHRVRGHEHLRCARLAGGAPRERLAAAARRRVRPLRGRLRRQRDRTRPRRVGPARRALRPRHERRLLDRQRRRSGGRRHPGRLARRPDRDRKRRRRAPALAAPRDRRHRRSARVRSRSSRATCRCPVAIEQLLAAFRSLASSPRDLAIVSGWALAGAAAKVAAATAVVASMGIDNPLRAALVLVPAVELAADPPDHAGERRARQRCSRARARLSGGRFERRRCRRESRSEPWSS